MAVLRHAITLRYAHDDNSAYLTCPVACLIRNAQGQWELGHDFLPPSLSLSASPSLINSLGDLVHRIQARCRRLMALRRESNERMADFAVADVSLFWLLNALNSSEPVLKEMMSALYLHTSTQIRSRYSRHCLHCWWNYWKPACHLALSRLN